MYNLIKYSDIYLDSFRQFKRDEVPVNNADLTVDNSQQFQYKADFVGKNIRSCLSKQHFKEKLDKNEDYVLFLRNQKLQSYSFTKEQQKFCKNI